MENQVCKNTGTYADYFPICCTTNISAEVGLLIDPAHRRGQSMLMFSCHCSTKTVFSK
jgi:hypothetical protein